MNPDHSFECNAPDVVFENFGDGSVILNLQSGNYYSLDGVGILYWEYFSQGNPPGQIAATFADVMPERGFSGHRQRSGIAFCRVAFGGIDSILEYLPRADRHKQRDDETIR